MSLWVSFALLGAGILAIYLEIFVPAAGLIGLAGGGMIVAGVVFGYVHHDPMTGSIVLITSLVVTPTAIMLALKAFPNTPVGKRLILSSVLSVDRSTERRGSGEGGDTADGGETADGAASGGDDRYASLARGTEGEAMTVLRPSGTGRFGRTRVSVVTSGEFIERGAPIRIVRVEGNRVVVREAPRSES
ncbi:MAG: NfeD family protein [Spirochaetota bacterium]